MVNAIKKLCKVCLVATMVLTPSSVLAQNVVKGTVLDANNEPVIGASVIERATLRMAQLLTSMVILRST